MFRRPRQPLMPAQTGLFSRTVFDGQTSPTRRFVYAGDTPFSYRDAVNIKQWRGPAWNRALAFHHLRDASNLIYRALKSPGDSANGVRKHLARESIEIAKSYEDKVRLP